MESSLPFMAMVLAVTALATGMIISKMAMSTGTSFFILSFYSNALATLILFPCGFFFHRSKRPPLTFSILWRIFLLALFGYIADVGSYAGINYSSPTLGTALVNLVPGFTYILAIIFRMEGLNCKRSSDVAKSAGTVISIVGASVVTFYKGPAIINKLQTLHSPIPLLSSQQNWILGGILLAMAALSTASWCILQSSILKMYPAEMIVVAFYCLFVTLQALLGALIAERDVAAWRLHADMGLVAIIYAGVINITFRLFLMSWCLLRTGPLFVSLFNPLTIVIAVVIGVIFQGEVLYFGSIAGAIVLVAGFYAVIWGRAEEEKTKRKNESNNAESSGHEVPLLQDQIEEA
ncbi:WAT1-related protein At5g40240-like [Olea europaea var. sylvestris]|uniref:WAT1-related protein At5g40240-like n=1 Tax=Olea europaea var. sylvestris TaxID=158386 RepID=UPI000C1D25A5|nr:WAT1-related protein At5g40240-like [Olea europaea var. sylvestris]